MQRVIIELLYGCGLRVSELVGLKINNFDLSAKYLTALGKGSKERIVPLGSKAIDAIKNFLPERDFLLKKYRLDTKQLLINEKGHNVTRQEVYSFIHERGKKIPHHIHFVTLMQHIC